MKKRNSPDSQQQREAAPAPADSNAAIDLGSIIFLISLTFVVIPVVSYYFDKPLNNLQLETLDTLLRICGSSAVLVFLVSTVTRNYSQVDKLWSLMPVIYAWVMAWYGQWHPRLLLISVLLTVWGARLTFNFARKGGYQWKFWEGEEDYRWPVVRQNPIFANPIVWFIFNLLFISFYQMALLLIIDAPMLIAMENPSPLNGIDAVAAFFVAGFILMETVADEQQWKYQTMKYKLRNEGRRLPEKFSRGFITEGLFARSRHPNYFAEQAIWVSLYLFSVAATDRWLNWSLVGSVLLVLLFQGSADLTEKLSMSKYPAYREYITRVPKFFPNLW